MVASVGLAFASGYEAAMHGPYTQWFNQRLKVRAEEAHLVGASTARVTVVLGRPDDIMEFWQVIGADGLPAPGAEFVTTYEYYPYPWLRLSKFQAHTTRGTVRSLEMFDD